MIRKIGRESRENVDTKELRKQRRYELSFTFYREKWKENFKISTDEFFVVFLNWKKITRTYERLQHEYLFRNEANIFQVLRLLIRIYGETGKLHADCFISRAAPWFYFSSDFSIVIIWSEYSENTGSIRARLLISRRASRFCFRRDKNKDADLVSAM